MSTAKLIGLRLFNVTCGRLPFGAHLLRKALVWRYVTAKPAASRYSPTSKFFEMAELSPGKASEKGGQ